MSDFLSGTAGRFVVLGTLALTLALSGIGCKSSGEKPPRSASLVSLPIHGSDAITIRNATLAVFTEQLFESLYVGESKLVFEKRGSFMKDLAYGSWMNSAVWIRVKIDITKYGATSHLLECDPFAVSGRNDSFFEEERRLTRLSKGTYKDLLREVKRRVEPPPPPKS